MNRVQVCGHFGELLQGRLGPSGPLALITLPCPALRVHARRHVPQNGLQIHVPKAAPRAITPQQARQFLAKIGHGLRGRISLASDMPLGAGAGVSTATLIALARLAGWRGLPLNLARACVAHEGASDPLMLPNPERVLWASREGRILAHLPALPAFDIVGGFWGAPTPTNPADQTFPDIAPLIGAWRSAALAQNLDALARLCSQSAQATLALRGPAQDPTPALALALGAKGFVIAHTGAARGLIFAKGTAPQGCAQSLRQAGLSGVLCFTHRPAKDPSC